jgi:hypothetical protein
MTTEILSSVIMSHMTSRRFRHIDLKHALSLENTQHPYCLVEYNRKFYIEHYPTSSSSIEPVLEEQELIVSGSQANMSSIIPLHMPSAGKLKYTVITPFFLDNGQISLVVK